jgi:membrane protease YdiL (CAAX protease family)
MNPTTFSLTLFGVELLLFAAIFWADAAGYVPISKTPFLLVVAWASIRLRGLRWRAVGLEWRSDGTRLLAIGAAAGVAFWAFEYFLENPALHALTGKYPDLTDFRFLVGNVAMLALILLMNLILAAFGEEMVWRGFALPRVAELLGGSNLAWAIAILGVNIAFGLAHTYQGESGVVQAGVQGVLLGVLYLFTGRNLIAPITAHFTANTCDFALLYLGTHVGLTG